MELLVAVLITIATQCAFAVTNGDGRGSDGASAPISSGDPCATRNSAIRFGMSTVLSGPTAPLGRNASAGFQAAFLDLNRDGGWHGRDYELTVLDDGYEPSRAATNVNTLLDTDVLAIIGNVGTPTGVVTRQICADRKRLFYAPVTGASSLRQSDAPKYVAHLRGSYNAEIESLVGALISGMGIKPGEIGFITQRDAFGDAGFKAGVLALAKVGVNRPERIVHGRYERNTNNVENALAELMLAGTPVRAVIVIGTHAPCVRAMQLARQNNFNIQFATISFANAEEIIHSGGAEVDGLIASQVVPLPTSDTPVAQRYRRALELLNKETGDTLQPHHASFEGFLAGMLLHETLANVPAIENPADVVRAFQQPVEVRYGDGLELKLDKTRRQASDRTWLTIVRNGRLEELTLPGVRAVP